MLLNILDTYEGVTYSGGRKAIHEAAGVPSLKETAGMSFFRRYRDGKREQRVGEGEGRRKGVVVALLIY